jgi:imidazoleglycerol-phosphate dehydratase
VVVRAFPGAVRISVRDEFDDDRLLDAIGRSQGEMGEAPYLRRDRVTAETRLNVRLRLRGQRHVFVDTGSGLYEHFFTQLGFHGGLDLRLVGVGDHETGDHHTVEDMARALGESLDAALGDRSTIVRYRRSAYSDG